MFIYLLKSVKMMMLYDKCFCNALEEKSTKFFMKGEVQSQPIIFNYYFISNIKNILD